MSMPNIEYILFEWRFVICSGVPLDEPRSLLKDMEKYECFRFRIGAVNGPATELCRLVVRGSMLLLLLANVVAIPAAIVPQRMGFGAWVGVTHRVTYWVPATPNMMSNGLGDWSMGGWFLGSTIQPRLTRVICGWQLQGNPQVFGKQLWRLHWHGGPAAQCGHATRMLLCYGTKACWSWPAVWPVRSSLM